MENAIQEKLASLEYEHVWSVPISKRDRESSRRGGEFPGRGGDENTVSVPPGRRHRGGQRSAITRLETCKRGRRILGMALGQ